VWASRLAREKMEEKMVEEVPKEESAMGIVQFV
jgi:hypothetical protein